MRDRKIIEAEIGKKLEELKKLQEELIIVVPNYNIEPPKTQSFCSGLHGLRLC